MRRPALLLHALVLTLAVAPSAVADGPSFRITIDRDAWQRFEFRYPTTYVFTIDEAPQQIEVRRRDGLGANWTTLEVKTADDLFNGIECVRLDAKARRLYVSVGFQTGPTMDLEFPGVKRAEFFGIAKYYDGRTAACSLSVDNWGRQKGANPGAAWRGPADDQSDNYQAALHVCRSLGLPVSIAINTGMYGGDALWQTMQEELDRRDLSWEPAVHARTHPCKADAYAVNGYRVEILGCRDELLRRLHNIPYGQHIFEHILTCGYQDESIFATDRQQFLFVRGYNSHDNPTSRDYAPWNERYGFYGVGGLSYKAYDAVFQRRKPSGRYYAADVQSLNAAFDEVYQRNGIFYAMWHPDRYRNSAIHDPRPGIDGVQGSSLIQHLNHLAHRKDVWYVPNGWLYCYRYVTEHAHVQGL